jgi:hypothetical protein
MHPLLKSLDPLRQRARACVAVSALIAAVTLLAIGPQVSQGREPATPRADLTLRALARTAPEAGTAAATTSRGLTPQQIQTAYGLPTRGLKSQTVAIVSAFGDPDVNSDLAAYDKRFHLPACTTKNGCVRKLNENGKSSPLPATDSITDQWVTESALGTEVVHGLCQSCRILLVEADTADEPSFSKAAQAAADAGATAVVTTFTGTESSGDDTYASDYANPRTAFVAAVGDPLAGDYGYSGDVNFPAVLPSVLAVGGTQLRTGADGRYGGETAWKGTVTGCSLYETDPTWQTSIAKESDCGPKRVDADLAAIADPGVIVHIAGATESGGPWYVAGGTSVSAPVIGAVIGLAGSAGANEAKMLYSRQSSDPGAFHDILTGANASICKSVICKAGKGWDGPTGLGTPAGLEAFLPAGPKLAAAQPRISLTAAKNTLRASRQWTVSLALTNGNPFRISGSLSLQRTLAIGGRTRRVTFATQAFKRASLAGGSTKLTIANAERSLLTGEHSLDVYAYVRARGETGAMVTVTRRLTLAAP